MGKKRSIYSLAISPHKIKEIKAKKSSTISHDVSPRWENFYRKNRKRIRFYESIFMEECICHVVSMKKIYQLGKQTIIIEVRI